MPRPAWTRIGRTAALACAVAACDTGDDRPARWGYIHAAIIAPSCATAACHSAPGSAAGINLANREFAYTFLTGHICGEPPRLQDPPRNYVTPFSSEYSQLIYQLRGSDDQGRPYREVMPPDAPLPDVEIELVARWIDEGAACD